MAILISKMRTRLRSILLILSLMTVCSAQSSIKIPCLGKLVDPSGTLRDLCGVSGSLLLSEPAPEPGSEAVISAGFSRRAGFIKTARSLKIFEGAVSWEIPTIAGAALFAFQSNGAPAFAYLVESGELLQWNGQAMLPIPFDAGGQVVSIGVGADNGWLAIVRRQDALVVVSAGNVSAVAEGTLLISGGRILRYSNGALSLGDLSFPFDMPPSIVQWINEEWIHLGNSVLRITPGKEGLFLLQEGK